MFIFIIELKDSFICSISFQKHSYVISYNFIVMRTGSNLNDLMMSLAGRTDSKLGFTTTVKEQV